MEGYFSLAKARKSFNGHSEGRAVRQRLRALHLKCRIPLCITRLFVGESTKVN